MLPINLVKEVESKMFLSLDYEMIHHRKQVIDRLDASEAQIECFNLSSCGLELDHEEQLNTVLKQAVRAKEPGSANSSCQLSDDLA